jgi:hypothetical protein
VADVLRSDVKMDMEMLMLSSPSSTLYILSMSAESGLHMLHYSLVSTLGREG